MTDCKTIAPLRSVAWPLLNLDVGLFYNALAISALCLSARCRSPHKTALAAEALHYYSIGLGTVNERLGDGRHQHIEGIVLGIMGIAIFTLTPSRPQGWCWERLDRTKEAECQSDQWLLHMRAIQTLLSSRVGVASLASNMVMRHWLFLMDLEGAITRDVRPLFSLPSHISGVPDRMPEALRKAGVILCIQSWMRELPARNEAIDIFADLDCTTSWLAEQLRWQGEAFWKEPRTDALRILPLIHRTLQLPGDDESTSAQKGQELASNGGDCAFEKALRHAIILFLAPIRRRFGPPAGGSTVHLTGLRRALELCLDHPSALQLQKLMFWMGVVGAMEACHLHSSDASWFFERLIDGCAIAGLMEARSTELFIRHAMSELIWFEEAMASAFELMIQRLQEFMQSVEMTQRLGVDPMCHQN